MTSTNKTIAVPVSLDEVQRWMQSLLISPMLQVTEDDVAAMVNSSGKLNAMRHLAIYRQSYIARLRECMKNQFSALAYALGEELFRMFTDEYLSVHPSGSYTLNDLGQHFTAFLEKTRPDAAEKEKETWPDFMIELATFEYNLSLIFDETIYETGTYASDHTKDESLILAPSVYLFHHRFPICRYYLEFTQQQMPELPFPEESYCVVTRKNYKLGLLQLQPAQYHLLMLVKQGKKLNEAKEQLCRQGYKQEVLDAIWPEWKKNFIASGFFYELS